MLPLLEFEPVSPTRSVKLPNWKVSEGPVRASSLAKRRATLYRFEKESDMVKAMCEQVDGIALEAGYVEVRREWILGDRIADLALAAYRDRPIMDKRLQCVARLSMLDQAILAKTILTPSTPEDIADAYFLPHAQVTEVVKKLSRMELVSCTDRGTYFSEDWSRFLPSIHLIEAKLDDWEGALRQALYYRPYADGAWVALPEKFSNNSELYTRCHLLGLGLMLIGPDGSIVRAVSPEAPKVERHHQKMQTAIRLIRRLVLDSRYGHGI